MEDAIKFLIEAMVLGIILGVNLAIWGGASYLLYMAVIEIKRFVKGKL